MISYSEGGGFVEDLKSIRSLKQEMTMTMPTSKEFPSRPYHTDYQNQYLVKYSQLPTNEFIKLKLMAENFEKTKQMQSEN